MKIGHKLTLGFVGMTVLMAALGYICLRTSQATLEQAIGKNSADLAEQIINKIDKDIYRRIEETQTYAADELLNNELFLSNEQFECLPDPNIYIRQVENVWNQHDNGQTSIMEQLSNNKLAKELRSKKDFYLDKYGYPLISEMFITNKFGANIAQTNKTTDYYQADEQWWQTAKQQGLFVSDIKYEDSSKTFSYEIDTRINDANGNFIGVAKVVINSLEISDAINRAKAGSEFKTTQFCLLSQDANILYSTIDNYSLSSKKDSLISLFCHPDLSEHKLFSINNNAGEKDVLFAHAHSKGYKNYSGLGRVLLMEIDSAEVFAPIAGLRNTLLLAGLVILGLSLLASSITYRSVIVPLAEIQKATVQIAAGNLDTCLVENEKDEIGQLACSMQQMARQLKKTITALNDEIGQRKNAQEQLQNNQMYLNNIFDSIQNGIGIMDKDLTITKVNAWIENAHWEKLPLVGKKCYQVYHNRDSSCPDCPSALTLKTGKPETKIFANHCSQTEWIELSSFPLKDYDGNITGVIEHVRDVTANVKAEKTLRESEAHFRTMLDNILTGVFIIDPETHKIVYANPIASRLTGQSREKLVGSSCHKFICPDEKGKCPITDLNQKINNSERTLLTANGEKLQIIKTVVSIDYDGRPHLLESFVDIADLKEAENALEKLNNDLEITVNELSRANKQMQDFVHIAAHDLKTPVRGIGTLADWIIADYGDKLDERGREQISLLKVRVLKIDKIIEAMLRFSKIASNKKEEKKLNLNKIALEAVGNIKAPENIDIAVDSLPVLFCHREHILQIFQNLLANSVAFMDKPKGIIKIGCTDNDNFWKFFVRDNGPGIEQKHFDRIFKIFQTLQEKSEPETTGIGLAIVKKIVELYGGSIWVESQLGQGSTFFFTIPKQQEESINEPIKANSAC